MIGQKNRFHGYNSLRYVYNNGKTVRGQDMAIRYAQNPRRKTYRVAVVVSKKISKSAVTRNRIRRRIYELVRNNAVLIDGTPDIVITIYSEKVATMDHQLLQKNFIELLKQTKISE